MNEKYYYCIAQNASLTDHFGLTTYLKNIVKYINNDKIFNLNVFIIRSLDNETNNDKSNIHYLDGDVYSLKGNLIFLYKLYVNLRKNKDIKVIHCLYPFSSLISALIYKFLINKEVKIIYDIRSPWIDMGTEKGLLIKPFERQLKNILYKVEKLLFKGVDYFIFITDELKSYYEKKLNIKIANYSIIPSGVDTKFFKNIGPNFLRSKYNIKKDELIIGYSGTIQKNREMDFIITALKQIKKSDFKFKMFFIGDGDDKERLEQMSIDNDLNEKIFFTGKISYESMPKYISGFDFAICHLPNKFIFKYSFPLKILEYLACDVPVLCSKIYTHEKISNQLKNVFIYSDIDSFHFLLKHKLIFKKDEQIIQFDWKEITNSISNIWLKFYNEKKCNNYV